MSYEVSYDDDSDYDPTPRRAAPRVGGLERDKFFVSRNDGRDLPGGDKAGALYFVLDYKNDPVARQALVEYARLVRASEPALAEDLFDVLAETE